jgi:hypothetical protein
VFVQSSPPDFQLNFTQEKKPSRSGISRRKALTCSSIHGFVFFICFVPCQSDEWKSSFSYSNDASSCLLIDKTLAQEMCVISATESLLLNPQPSSRLLITLERDDVRSLRHSERTSRSSNFSFFMDFLCFSLHWRRVR